MSLTKMPLKGSRVDPLPADLQSSGTRGNSGHLEAVWQRVAPSDRMTRDLLNRMPSRGLSGLGCRPQILAYRSIGL
jgi:hypothetical protein